MTRYNLNEFPVLYEYLQSNFGVSNVHGGDSFQITNEGKLIRHMDDFMFCSYDTWEYGPDKQNSFYDDLIRSAPESKVQQPQNKNTKRQDNVYSSKKNDTEFETFAYLTFKHIKSKILRKHEQKCWRLLRIIYDYPKPVSSKVAALCVNQMFSTKLKTSMRKYNNNKRVKMMMQEIREAFSCQH